MGYEWRVKIRFFTNYTKFCRCILGGLVMKSNRRSRWQVLAIAFVLFLVFFNTLSQVHHYQERELAIKIFEDNGILLPDNVIGAGFVDNVPYLIIVDEAGIIIDYFLLYYV